MPKAWLFVTTLFAFFAPSATRAHELWLHCRPGTDAGVARLTFGDGPDLGAAERVAEIASAKVPGRLWECSQQPATLLTPGRSSWRITGESMERFTLVH
jgi:hypothetical protein